MQTHDQEKQAALASTHRLIARRLAARRRGARWLFGTPLLAACVAAFLVCTTAPGAVLACFNTIAVTVDGLGRRVSAAEKRLNHGDTVGAVQGLRFALGVVRNGRVGEYELVGERSEARAVAVRARAETLFAVAVVRRDGLVDRRRLRAGWVPDRVRAANLAWAKDALAGALRRSPDAPEAIARHAEALARVPNGSDAAVAALRELDRRDLMPDAWGYAALARLADTRHDAAERDRAITQCTVLAGEYADAICPPATALR